MPQRIAPKLLGIRVRFIISVATVAGLIVVVIDFAGLLLNPHDLRLSHLA